uniref:Cyclin-dependent kinases regulatory subunit n=1 Tax=Picea sitchensis TaxID=3332 RepID=D5ACV7_PICSI|nr:unknown [Picea sitchensis]
MSQMEYSEKYYDDTYEYRHVELPPDVAQFLPKNRLLTENEWRGIGVQQSRGWVHYAIHCSEPHIMLFRRPLNYEQNHQHPEAHIMLFRRPLNHQPNHQPEAHHHPT